MSKLFYDHLIILEEIEIDINRKSTSKEEKEELWKLVDNLIHTRIMDIVLSSLPGEHHAEFLEKFSLFPHDERLIGFIKEKGRNDIEDLIKAESEKLKKELSSQKKRKKK